MQVWDSAGQERFRVITKQFATCRDLTCEVVFTNTIPCGPRVFRGAAAAVVVFSVTNRASFDNLSYWVNTVQDAAKTSSGKILLWLVGNKCDRPAAERDVSAQDVAEFITNANVAAKYVETSALDGSQIEELFGAIADHISSAADVAPPPPAGAGLHRWNFSDDPKLTVDDGAVV